MDYPKEFIEELRLQLKRHHEAQSSLNTKTNALLVVSGITAGIILGFYGNIISNQDIALHRNVLIIPIICIICSIVTSLVIFQPRVTSYPIVSSHYFDQTGKIINSKVKERCEKNIGDVTITVSSYFEAMRDIEKQNETISKCLRFGIISYISGMIIWISLIYAVTPFVNSP